MDLHTYCERLLLDSIGQESSDKIRLIERARSVVLFHLKIGYARKRSTLSHAAPVMLIRLDVFICFESRIAIDRTRR